MPDEEKEVEIRKGFVPPERPRKPDEVIQEGYVPPPPPPPPPEKPEGEPPEKQD